MTSSAANSRDKNGLVSADRNKRDRLLAAPQLCHSGRPIRLSRVGWWLIVATMLMTSHGPAQAEFVIDKIKRTGTLSMGARVNGLVPFSFKDETGAFNGFSIDIMLAIHRSLERHLGMHIKRELNEVDAETRFSHVKSGELDIVCDATTPTRQREEIVDFSVTTFFDGSRLMVDRNHSTGDIGNLRSPRVGAITNSTVIEAVRSKVPNAEFVLFPNLQEAFTNLEAGKIDAIADNNVILRQLHRQAERPGRYSMLPLNNYLSIEAFACIVPENDSSWRNFVNNTIADMLKDVDRYRGEYYDIYRRWFRSGNGPQYPLSSEAINHLKNINDIYQ